MLWRALSRVVVETWEDCWPGELRGAPPKPPPMLPRDIMEWRLLFVMVEVSWESPEGVESGGCVEPLCWMDWLARPRGQTLAACWVARFIPGEGT